MLANSHDRLHPQTAMGRTSPNLTMTVKSLCMSEVGLAMTGPFSTSAGGAEPEPDMDWIFALSRANGRPMDV